MYPKLWIKTIHGGHHNCNKKGRKLGTAIRYPTDRNKTKDVTAQKKYAEQCDKQRNQSWSDFMEKLDSIKAVNQFRKKFEKHINIEIGTLTKPYGDITDPGQDTIHYLLATHFPNATEKRKANYLVSKYITKSDPYMKILIGLLRVK